MPSSSKKEAIDHNTQPPLLIHIFPKMGGHNFPSDYADADVHPPGGANAHTWLDATLYDVARAVRAAEPKARGAQLRLSLAFVYPDKRGRLVLKKVGVVQNGRSPPADAETLADLHFEAGDHIDVAILGGQDATSRSGAGDAQRGRGRGGGGGRARGGGDGGSGRHVNMRSSDDRSSRSDRHRRGRRDDERGRRGDGDNGGRSGRHNDDRSGGGPARTERGAGSRRYAPY
jgi:histone deacetylase complex subunit SAP18